MKHSVAAFRGVLTLAVILGLPANALANSDIVVTTTTVGPDGHAVKVEFHKPANPGTGGCVAGYTCDTYFASITVTPCPPGVSCSGGSHTYNVQIGSAREFILDLGVNYSFTGTWERRFAYNRPCTYSCSAFGNLDATSFIALDLSSLPRWEITPVSITADAIVVDATMRNMVIPVACLHDWLCIYREPLLTVTPCAIDVRGGGPKCFNGTSADRVFNLKDDVPSVTFRVTLAPYQDYVFDGDVYTQGLVEEMGGGCISPWCVSRAYAMPTSYNSSVATMPVTWGHVKSLYRSP